MKISKKSWAYRVWHWNNYGTPYDLCSFVRETVWSFVKHVTIWSFGVLAAAVVAFFALTPFLYSWFGVQELAAPAVVVFSTYIILSVMYFTDLARKALASRLNRLTLSRKEPGLIRSYYRAKKQKICPFITVTE